MRGYIKTAARAYSRGKKNQGRVLYAGRAAYHANKLGHFIGGHSIKGGPKPVPRFKGRVGSKALGMAAAKAKHYKGH